MRAGRRPPIALRPQGEQALILAAGRQVERLALGACTARRRGLSFSRAASSAAGSEGRAPEERSCRRMRRESGASVCVR